MSNFFRVRRTDKKSPVFVDLFGRLEDSASENEGDHEKSGLASSIFNCINGEIENGCKFVVVNCSKIESLDLPCSMALCALGPRIWAWGGALVLCACPDELHWAITKIDAHYAPTEQEALALCKPGSDSTGVLWPTPLNIERQEGGGTTLLTLTGGYWGESAYGYLAEEVKKIETDKIVFLASDLTAFCPDGVGPFLKLHRELKEKKTRFCWCEFPELPKTLLQGTGVLGTFPYFDSVQEGGPAIDSLGPGEQLSLQPQAPQGCGSKAGAALLLVGWGLLNHLV